MIKLKTKNNSFKDLKVLTIKEYIFECIFNLKIK